MTSRHDPEDIFNDNYNEREERRDHLPTRTARIDPATAPGRGSSVRPHRRIMASV
jgi:hypothetical protein